MTGTRLALLAAATGLAIVLLAPGVAPARPRWTGMDFESVDARISGKVALRGWFVSQEVPSRYRGIVGKACIPDSRIVIKSAAFDTPHHLASTRIRRNGSFVLLFRPVSVAEAHAELVACGSSSFSFSNEPEGVGGLFNHEVIDAITLAPTGSGEATMAGVAAALLGGGILLLFLTRKRRRPSLPSN
jgi:hypothetical protein